jgi:hypothetical protein
LPSKLWRHRTPPLQCPIPQALMVCQERAAFTKEQSNRSALPAAASGEEVGSFAASVEQLHHTVVLQAKDHPAPTLIDPKLNTHRVAGLRPQSRLELRRCRWPRPAGWRALCDDPPHPLDHLILEGTRGRQHAAGRFGECKGARGGCSEATTDRGPASVAGGRLRCLGGG